MKKIGLVLIKLLSYIWGLLPKNFRVLMVTTIFLIESRVRSPQESIKLLFEIKDRLDWVINESSVRLGDGVHVKHRITNYHNYFLENIIDGESVLDVGCGQGEVAYSVAIDKKNSRVVGIDNNESRLKKAIERNHYENLSFYSYNAIEKVPSGEWNVVILSNVLEHIDNRIEFLVKLINTTQAKKYLIRVPLFERDWQIGLRKELGINYFSDDDHKIEHTLNEFELEISAAGLNLMQKTLLWGEIWARCEDLRGVENERSN